MFKPSNFSADFTLFNLVSLVVFDLVVVGLEIVGLGIIGLVVLGLVVFVPVVVRLSAFGLVIV